MWLIINCCYSSCGLLDSNLGIINLKTLLLDGIEDQLGVLCKFPLKWFRGQSRCKWFPWLNRQGESRKVEFKFPEVSLQFEVFSERDCPGVLLNRGAGLKIFCSSMKSFSRRLVTEINASTLGRMCVLNLERNGAISWEIIICTTSTSSIWGSSLANNADFQRMNFSTGSSTLCFSP